MGQIFVRLAVVLSAFSVLVAFGCWFIGTWAGDDRWGGTGVLFLLLGAVGLCASLPFVEKMTRRVK
jgi:hypothetical protein